jgi:oxygen-dependent protoporphyrinogen oxidase
VGHQARLATLREELARALPGVVVAGSAYEGLGLASCISSGEAAAAALALPVVPATATDTAVRA